MNYFQEYAKFEFSNKQLRVKEKSMENWAKIITGDSRRMLEVDDNSVQLIITSPPYWSIKDYGDKNQIGYGQTLHEYLKDLYRVWKESYRVLEP